MVWETTPTHLVTRNEVFCVSSKGDSTERKTKGGAGVFAGQKGED